MNKDNAQWVIIAIIFFAAITLHFINDSRNNTPEPEPTKTSPFSENCTFYKKVIGGDFTISEPKAGTFRYEVYATSEGIEVWKCNNF